MTGRIRSKSPKVGKDDYPVIVLCYDEEEMWDSCQEAIEFYTEGMLATDGSEQERYARIVEKLSDGMWYVTDGESQIQSDPMARINEMRMGVLRKTISLGPNTNISQAYRVFRPDMPDWQDIDQTISFQDLYDCLVRGEDVYQVIGFDDSIARENIFTMASEALGISYNDMYDLAFSGVIPKLPTSKTDKKPKMEQKPKKASVKPKKTQSKPTSRPKTVKEAPVRKPTVKRTEGTDSITYKRKGGLVIPSGLTGRSASSMKKKTRKG